jgi:hypothetical protein
MPPEHPEPCFLALQNCRSLAAIATYSKWVTFHDGNTEHNNGIVRASTAECHCGAVNYSIARASVQCTSR